MATIGIFDSGSGGLSVLREIRKILPEQRYIYFSDNAHCPYGEKSAQYITDRYEPQGVIVVNNLKEVRDSDFRDRDFPTEHYKQTGRLAIARNVAEAISGKSHAGR